MSLGEVLKPAQSLVTGRLLLVGYLPTAAAAVFLLLLAWAGAPEGTLRFGRAWETVAGLGPGELVLMAFGILVLALLAAPLQLSLVRLLEGAWPRWLGAGPARRWQARRRARLAAAAKPSATEPDGAPSAAETQRAGVAAARLRRRYPLEEHLIRPTALGNVLAAMEDTAGRPYGLDAVAAWPRLYPLLAPAVKSIVDDRRDSLDAAARLAVTGAITAVAAAVLLSGTGWWLLLAAVPALIAVAAYRGAVEAALAYAEAVHVCFDLHRFDLLRALHLPLPADRDAEVALNTQLCAQWRQNLPLKAAYQHEPDPDPTPEGPA